MGLEYDFQPNDVDERQPLIYLWEVTDGDGVVGYRYVGKSINGSHRPKAAYRLNVNHLLDGKPYRKGNPDGFRVVHRRLADATRGGAKIQLSLICNVGPGEDIFERERHWQAVHGADPADGAIDAD